MKLYFLVPLISIGLAIGCRTPMSLNLKKIELGMEKDQIIELLGPPQVSQRLHGQDVWTYIFYDKENKQGRELVFENGRLSRLGEAKFEPTNQEKMEDSTSMEEYESLV